MSVVRPTGVVRIFALSAVLIASGGGASPTVSAPGVPNFHRVNDDIYRGGQPTAQGFRTLAKLGIKTVLDLRTSSGPSFWEKKEVKSVGMRYVQLPLYGDENPTPSEIKTAFAVLDDKSQAPIFIHCHAGKDRTGMIIGCYRIFHDGWPTQKALAEAKSYAGRDLTSAMEQYILHFNRADINLGL
jgi:protein tyrosine/serine phosphatase